MRLNLQPLLCSTSPLTNSRELESETFLGKTAYESPSPFPSCNIHPAWLIHLYQKLMSCFSIKTAWPSGEHLPFKELRNSQLNEQKKLQLQAGKLMQGCYEKRGLTKLKKKVLACENLVGPLGYIDLSI